MIKMLFSTTKKFIYLYIYFSKSDLLCLKALLQVVLLVSE